MLKVWILVAMTSTGGEIEIAAYDTFEDCIEIAAYLNTDFVHGAMAVCFEGVEK